MLKGWSLLIYLVQTQTKVLGSAKAPIIDGSMGRSDRPVGGGHFRRDTICISNFVCIRMSHECCCIPRGYYLLEGPAVPAGLPVRSNFSITPATARDGA